MSDADKAIHRIFEANRLLREAGEQLASTVGQTHARRMVLQAADGGVTVPDIARKLGLHRQGIQRIADELVAEGLARYTENPRHRSSKLVVITDHGAAALSNINQLHNTWITDIETRSSDIDWPALRNDLDQLIAVLASQPACATATAPH